MVRKNCVQCGAEFDASHGGVKYCGDACRREHERDRYHKRWTYPEYREHKRKRSREYMRERRATG